MARESFILYLEQQEIFEMLSDEEAGQLIKAIFEYEQTGEMKKLDKSLQIAFIPIKNVLDRNKDKYEKVLERNRENGKKGGRPKNPVGYLGYKEKPKKADNDNEYDNEHDSDNENVNEHEKKVHFANAEYVTMTNAEYEKLVSTYGNVFADQCITELDNYKGAKGKKYKSDYRAILSWVVDKLKDKGFKPKPKTNEEAKREIYFNANDLTEEQYILYMRGELTNEDILKILEEKNV